MDWKLAGMAGAIRGASGRKGGILMEPLLLIVGFVALGVLAVRFGHDSRDALPSAEANLARLGARWNGRPASPAPRLEQISPPPLPRHAGSLRHRLAGLLYRLAEWLYPGATDTPQPAPM